MSDESKLQMLVDRTEISDTVIRYATGVDMQDWEAFRSCFTDEVDIDMTSFRGGESQHLTADAWAERVRTGITKFKATQHLSTNHVITINGDEATCVSYMQARHYFPLETGENCFVMGGFYINTLVRMPQGWKISKMKQIVNWTEGSRALFEQYTRRA
ncbi:nuclear transport factor 2 family protein [Chloroflexota bacterium]